VERSLRALFADGFTGLSSAAPQHTGVGDRGTSLLFG